MRGCPICDITEKILVEKDYTHTSIINNGIKAGLSRYQCPACGFHYLDGEAVNQAWFDWYYLNVYQTDDDPYSDERLNSLADCVCQHKGIRVLDIGGMDGQLRQRIQARGNECDIAGAGEADELYRTYNTVILSHTLEHIYDITAMFERVKRAMTYGGWLYIEIPIHLNYKDSNYDRHWQHINKFRPMDIESLMALHGFTILVSVQLPDYREYKVWRIVGMYDPS